MIVLETDITGRILEATLINDLDKSKQKRVNREQFLNLVSSGKIDGATLTPTGTLLMNYLRYSKIKTVTVEKKIITKRDLNITKIYYYKSLGEKIVDSIEILVNNDKVVYELMRLGGERLDLNHIRMNKIALWRLCWVYSQITYELGFLQSGSSYNVKYIYVTYSKNVNKDAEFVKLDIDTTEKINAWVNKAKMLGIIDDYTIDLQTNTLCKYTGKEKNPLMPPVENIAENCFDGEALIEELNIPDTVVKIGKNIFTHLKKLNLSSNTVDVSNICINQSILDEVNIISAVSYLKTQWFRYARTTLQGTITTRIQDFTKGYMDANNINAVETYIEIFNI